MYGNIFKIFDLSYAKGESGTLHFEETFLKRKESIFFRVADTKRDGRRLQ